MENRLFGKDMTSELTLVNAPKNEDEAQESLGMRMEGIDGFAFFDLDHEGRVVYWHPSAMRMTGYKSEEITGQNYSCLYEGQETLSHKMPKYFLRIAVKQRFHEYQCWWLRRDATRFLARVLIMSMNYLGGDFVVMVWDLSHKREALAEVGGRYRTSLLE